MIILPWGFSWPPGAPQNGGINWSVSQQNPAFKRREAASARKPKVHPVLAVPPPVGAAILTAMRSLCGSQNRHLSVART
jgi:hypothetical protein